jgi:hypothetical protein
MQVFPQALPTEQTLQQVRAWPAGAVLDGVKSRLAIGGVENSIEVGAGSACADADSRARMEAREASLIMKRIS